MRSLNYIIINTEINPVQPCGKVWERLSTFRATFKVKIEVRSEIYSQSFD